MRVVLDTNVLVSGLIRAGGTPAAVLDGVVRDPSVVLLWDERMLDEYGEVLARPKFGLDPSRVRILLDRVREAGERVVAQRYDGPMPDEDDRPFVEVAVTGHADFLVTGNARHFPSARDLPSSLRIASPRQFLLALFVRSLLRSIFPWS